MPAWVASSFGESLSVGVRRVGDGASTYACYAREFAATAKNRYGTVESGAITLGASADCRYFVAVQPAYGAPKDRDESGRPRFARVQSSAPRPFRRFRERGETESGA